LKTLNIVVCGLMSNEHENVYVGVDWNEIGAAN
jgi:hypothetical protein